MRRRQRDLPQVRWGRALHLARNGVEREPPQPEEPVIPTATASSRPETLSEALARLEALERVVAVAEKRADIRTAEAEALRRSDALTGLPNHTAFAEKAADALAQAKRSGLTVALLLVDMDGFRAVNDALGHAVGDQVLVTCAARLRQVLRETDHLARLAGDEFAVLLQNLQSDSDAVHAAERILDVFANPVEADENQITCSVSIGVATSRECPAHDAPTLYQWSDLALHRAKAAGGNRYQFFDAALHEEARETKRIKAALGPALRDGQFHLVFQPRIDLRSGQPSGAEALLRWEHPEMGMVPPARFIPIAEASGQILPLCTWIIGEVYRHAVLWRECAMSDGLPLLPIAMNLSAVQLRDSSLRQELARLAVSHGVPAAAIELEVTETAAIGDIEHAADNLAGLRSDGHRVAIDDFGTGYASLALAVQLPADFLKIDRSFIADQPAACGSGRHHSGAWS